MAGSMEVHRQTDIVLQGLRVLCPDPQAAGKGRKWAWLELL